MRFLVSPAVFVVWLAIPSQHSSAAPAPPVDASGEHERYRVALQFVSHDWGYPFCTGQPLITRVFDHEHPTWGNAPNASGGSKNGIVRLFSNHNVAGCIGFDGHDGWDFLRRGGTQGCGGGDRPGMGDDGTNGLVFAVDNGTVVRSRWDEVPGLSRAAHEDDLGLVAIINNGGQQTAYAHLASTFVEEGESVNKGDMIGSVGTTGSSSGPHLHFGTAHGEPRIYTANALIFDPYGWDGNFDGTGSVPISDPDPWEEDGNHNPVSERKMLPGAGDNALSCPQACGAPVIVEDDSPNVTYNCTPASSGCNWRRQTAGGHSVLLHLNLEFPPVRVI